MKKYLAIALAAVMTMGLMTGCAPKAEPTTAPTAGATDAATTAAPEASDLNVGVFYYNYADVYMTSVRSALDAELKGAGITFTNYDAANQQATQNDQIATAIANGCNMLAVNIVDTAAPDAAAGAVEAAQTAGIPIVFFNREVTDEVVNSYEMCSFVGTNAPEAGHMQGKMVGEYVLENFDALDLNGDGTISYVMFKGQEGNAEAEARTQYGVEDADAVLTAAGKNALAFYDANNADKYLVDTNGAWSSQAATDYMDILLASYSEANGNMVEIVIANNDGMAEGAVASLQTAGYNKGEGATIPVFGVDATASACQLIDEGKMTGTVKQDAQGMAATICNLVVSVADGGDMMDNTADFNVDEGVAKIRVPYGLYTG